MFTQYKSIAVVGSRNTTKQHVFENLARMLLVHQRPEGFQIVSGGAPGADSHGAAFAKQYGLGLVEHIPDWNRNGQFIRSAGFERNAHIINDSEAVIAFWDGESKGTMHSIKLAIEAQKPLRIIFPNNVMFSPHSKYFQTGNIFWSQGNMLNSDDIFARSIVNPCNTKGIAGAGISRQLALKYPQFVDDYVAKCKDGEIATGFINNTFVKRSLNSVNIVHFPTKDDPRKPSQLQYIEEGLKDFALTYYRHGVTDSVVFPMLGCGLGGLDWNDVKPLMIKYLSKMIIRVIVVDKPHL